MFRQVGSPKGWSTLQAQRASLELPPRGCEALSVTCEQPGIWNFKKLYDCFAAREEQAKAQLPSDAQSLSGQLPLSAPARRPRTEPTGSRGRSPPEVLSAATASDSSAERGPMSLGSAPSLLQISSLAAARLLQASRMLVFRPVVPATLPAGART